LQCIQLAGTLNGPEGRHWTAYNLSRYHALKSETETSVKYLRKAIELGFTNPKVYTNEKDFDPIRNSMQYRQLMTELKEKH